VKSNLTVKLIAAVFVLFVCEGIARLGLNIFQTNFQQDWRFQDWRFTSVNYTEVVKQKRSMVEDILLDNGGYIQLDADLGWTVKPNGIEGRPSDGVYNDRLYQANSDGIRSSHEYQRNPSSDVVRVAVFGDSFSHADDVSNDAAWTAVWEQSNSNLEVLNFGVPGFGTDQAYLRYQKEGKEFSPDITVLGIMSENLMRNVNTFVPFYRPDAWPTSKPRFVFAPDGSFTLKENFFRDRSDYQALIDDLPATLLELGEHDWWYNAKYKPGILDNSSLFQLLHYSYIMFRYPWMLDDRSLYKKESEHYKILLEIIQRFSKEVEESGSTPVIVLFPSLEVLEKFRVDGNLMYSPLLDDLDKQSIRYVDVLDGFTKYGGDVDVRGLIPGHNSVIGNEMAARYINEELQVLIESNLTTKQNR